MLKIAHRRLGFSKSGTSLLNYVGKKGAAASRMSALSAGAVNTRNARIEKSGYEKLEKSAYGLCGALSSLTVKADSEGENPADEAAVMVEKFNETLKNLRGSSGVLNQFYYQSLRDISETNKSGLEEIGITVSADGSLTLHKEKFAGADRDKVGKLLGSKGDFSQRTGLVASRTADNAQVNAFSASSRYNSRGSVDDSYLNKYNFWG